MKDSSVALDEKELQTATWAFISSYFRDDGTSTLVKHQIDSYNDFVLRKIEQVIEGFNPIEVHHQFLPTHGVFYRVMRITVDNPLIGKPVINEKDGSTKTMMPNDARLRSLTYAGTLMVDLTIDAQTYDPERKSYISETKKLTNVSLGKLPIMVRSRYCMLSQPASRGILNSGDECENDYGGYFIVNGNEKVIITQDRIAENKTYVFTTIKAPYSHVAEIRSVQENRFGVPKTTALKLTSKDTQFKRCIRVNLHHVKNDVPLFILFRALGVESDKDIVRMIVHDLDAPIARIITEELMGCMDEASGCTTTAAAMEYLARYLHAHGRPRELCTQPIHRLAIVHAVLEKEFLPHTGPRFPAKALYLGYMTNKLVRCYKELLNLDDRDSYVNKRLNTPGVCMANLFRQYYGKAVKEIKSSVQREINSGAWRATNKFVNVINVHNVYKIVRSTIIESGLKCGLATGNWGLKSTRMRAGVAQVLNRLSYMGTISHLRRVNAPIEKTGKLVHPRMLNNTQFGIICPHETPEGSSIGLVKNMSITCSITVAACSEAVRTKVVEFGTIPFNDTSTFDLTWFRTGTMIFVNGDILGVHFEPQVLHEKMRGLKRSGGIDVHTSISWYVMRNEMHFSLEGGRCMHPLYIVDDYQRLRVDRPLIEAFRSPDLFPKATWNDLVLDDIRSDSCRPQALAKAVVEYLDVEETNCAMIAMSPANLRDNTSGLVRYSHMEMHPSLMEGAMAGSIPFADRNQAPRNTYQAAMGKQAIGLYATNFRHRFDTMGYVLNYPQAPLVSTHIAKLINCNKALCGINAVVAIACYSGFNQEDSVIINQSAIDRGLFGSTFFRSYREQKNKNHSSGEEEVFGRSDPSTTKDMKPFNYDKLAEDGFVPENTFVETGDIVIGKHMPQRAENGGVNNRDTSVVLKNNERCFVDYNAYNNNHFTNFNGDGYAFCKVRTRAERIPTIGDKFSCYAPGHEVLTADHGWVDISCIKPGVHCVATLVQGEVVYQYPTSVQEYSYGGQMCEVECDDARLLVTPNHRMYVGSTSTSLEGGGFDMRLAGDLAESGEAVLFSQSACGVRPPPRMQARTDSDADTMAILGFIGAVWSGGVLLNVEKGMNNHDVISPARYAPKHHEPVAKLRFTRSVVDYLDAISGLTYVFTEPRETVLVNEQRSSFGVLTGWCGTAFQHVPEWVWGLSTRMCGFLLDQMLLHSSNFGGFVPTEPSFLSAKSGSTADEIQRLCLHAGRVGIRVTGGIIVRPGEDFLATVRMSYVAIPTVYCCTVPEGQGVIYVRRGGKPVWCGQSRHGQKGTMGMLYRQEDMPYTSSGIVPDIIINPHAIPSRMTCGQLVECVMGKACCSKGAFGDATLFNGVSTTEVEDSLQDCGLHRSGDEIMYNSRTGEQMACTIMIGPTYYQRLKHMVDDKLHSRSNNGPVVRLTRQPAEGRARDGGLRLGEMEIDCNWAHGIMHFQKERFMECSDNYRVFLCKKCGGPAIVNPDINKYKCMRCPQNKAFSEVRIPYACKLLIQEINTIGVDVRMMT